MGASWGKPPLCPAIGTDGVESGRFMSAIEVITSTEKNIFITDDKTGERNKVRIKVWNDTVANLTLMALGSSAPEILLSILELLNNNWFSGALGPNTVVGSAAFNLMVISAVCVWAIPTGEVRYIIGWKVYAVTATFSLFAYFWLIIILQFISPNRVEIWEAIVTFLFFPLLVGIAWMVDVEMICAVQRPPMDHLTSAVYEDVGHDVSNEVLATIRKQIRDEYSSALNEESVQKLVVHRAIQMKPKSRAYYRVHAAKEMTGGGHGNADPLKAKAASSKQVHPTELPERRGSKYQPAATVGFVAKSFACLECVKDLKLAVVRSDVTKDVPLQVDFCTRPGTAKPGEDYIHTSGTLEFNSGELSKEICIKIVDDVQYEEDEDFYVDLSNVRCTYTGGKVDLGTSECTVTIIDDDEPGVLQFDNIENYVMEGKDEIVTLTVERRNGSSGVISCTFRTEDATAKAGTDYEPQEGKLVFQNGESAKVIEIPIIDDEKYEKREHFKVFIENADGGAKFNEKTEGGLECCEATIFIASDDKVKSRIQEVKEQLALAEEANRVGTHKFSEQFWEALGYEDDELMPGAGPSEWVMHCLSLPWKLLFAFIPPTDFCGGWLSFWCSLGMIAFVTAFVGDLASLLGCCLGLKDDVTAITLVALGTSLPDTFASKQAATADPYADASVGNVTGSNSVNVFLGLGLPWAMGSLYWEFGGMDSRAQDWERMRIGDGRTFMALFAPSKADPGLPGYPFEQELAVYGGFVVYAGDLAYSVTVYTALAITAVFFLLLRRKVYGGELGGTLVGKVIGAAFLVSLWLVYLALSIVKSMNSS